MSLEQIDKTQSSVVGGKAVHLGELSRIDGIRVPPGFCVTTLAYRRGDANKSVLIVFRPERRAAAIA
ncbi:MAG TPA: PEP/pyruvate-binding domain-containing protein [Gemmatimonadaceae bacterium]|nr:PEP/pyruvate-binding domain-containing protein [Gemmatimonadaceae bacterium]